MVLLLARFVFHVPLRGSLLLLYATTAPFILASLALGLFISTAVKTQIQAMQLSFLIILPSVLLSGFMFPREAMPTLAQWIGGAIPLTYFLRILRAILLKGRGSRRSGRRSPRYARSRDVTPNAGPRFMSVQWG
jgi:ABC-2 type transport system permease protein